MNSKGIGSKDDLAVVKLAALIIIITGVIIAKAIMSI
jgi:hypothetical protein